MYNISLYPLACEQSWVFNMLIIYIPSFSSVMQFRRFNIHSTDAGLRVDHIKWIMSAVVVNKQ